MTAQRDAVQGRAESQAGGGAGESAPPVPWYRQPWPWILMAGPVAAVIGSLVSAWLAVANADPVIDEDYYEHGLQINRQLQRQQAAERTSGSPAPTRSTAARPGRRSEGVSD